MVYFVDNYLSVMILLQHSKESVIIMSVMKVGRQQVTKKLNFHFKLVCE